MYKIYLIIITLLFLSCNNSSKNRENAEMFLEQEKFHKALTEINTAIQLDKDSSSFYVLRATIYDYLKEYDKEISDLTTIISLKKDINNSRFNAYFQRAYVLTQLGHYENALTDIDFYIDNSDSTKSLSDAYINKASILWKLNDFKKAKYFYQLSIDKNILKDKEIYLQAYVGLANLETNPNKALRILDNPILKNDSSAFLLGTRSSINMDLGNLKEAYSDLVKATKLNPTDPILNFNLGQIFANDYNNLDSAIIYFNNAIKYSSNSENFDVIYNQLGIIMNIQGNQKKALEYYELSEKNNPNNDVTLYNYSMLLSEIGENNKALIKINKAIKLNSKDAEHYNTKGNILMDLEQFEQSAKSFLEAVKIRSDYGGAYYNLGYLYGEQNNHKKSIQYYNRAIELDFDLEATLVNRALQKGKLNQINSACKDLKKAYKLGRKDILPLINKVCK